MDTMLHEYVPSLNRLFTHTDNLRLSHIVWGDHDANFHALWDELRGEYETLVSKGYTGEGFLSRGQKLGGGRVPPPDELRRLARASAEKRRTLTTGSGRKLGGAPLHRGTDPRKVIADAATRRNTINRGCASGTAEAGELAEQAGRNTFKTKADEDDANDRAIAEALLELMEEEENRKLNGTYATPPPSGGLGWTPETGLFSAGEAKEQAGAPMSEEEQMKWALQESMEGVRSHVPPALSLPSAKSAPPIPIQTKSIPLASPAAQSRSRPQMNSRPVSRLVAEAEAKKAGKKRPLSTDLTLKTNGSHDSAPNNNYALPSKPLQPSRNATAPDLIDLTSSSPPSSPIATSPSVSRHPSPPADPNSWTCTICTCINPLQFLSCDACGIDRPSFVSRNMARRAGNVANSNGTLNGGGTGKGSGLGWNCDRCGTFMEHKWWTCSRCGLVKRSS